MFESCERKELTRDVLSMPQNWEMTVLMLARVPCFRFVTLNGTIWHTVGGALLVRTQDLPSLTRH